MLKRLISIALAVNVPLLASGQAFALGPVQTGINDSTLKAGIKRGAATPKYHEAKQGNPDFIMLQIPEGTESKPAAQAVPARTTTQAFSARTAAGALAQRPALSRKEIEADQIVVQLKRGADKDEFNSLLEEMHGTVVNTLSVSPQIEILIVQAEHGKVAESEKKLVASKEIARIQRNTTYRIQTNDSLFSSEWDLAFMNWPQAQSLGIGYLNPVAMYFLDTGLQAVGHEAYQPARQYNFTGSDQFGGTPSGHIMPHLGDSGFHGTSTAQVACCTNNLLGFAGAANFGGSFFGPNFGNRVQLVECQISSDGETASLTNILLALNFLHTQFASGHLAPGPVNLSFGSPPPNTLNANGFIQLYAQAYIMEGSILVLASGNDGMVDGSALQFARPVGAIQQDGTIASFTDTGPAVTRFAPGVNVPCYFPYIYMAPFFASGTSFSAPRWCAAIAAVMAVSPGRINAYTADQIVFNTAIVTSQGAHVPNFAAALQAAAKF